MTNKSDWQTASRQLMAEQREQLGPPPTGEEIRAYKAGELTLAEADRIRDLLVAYPEVALAVANDDEAPAIVWMKGSADHFYAVVGAVILSVTRYGPLDTGRWQLSTTPQFGARPWLPTSIGRYDIEQAKAEALRLTEEILKPYADAYSTIAEERMR